MEKENYSQDELDNHSNQMNPNNDAYWQSRADSNQDDDDENNSNSDEDDGGPYDDYSSENGEVDL